MNKVNPHVYVLAAFVVMLAALMLVPIAQIIAFPWRLLGCAPLLLGMASVVYSLRMFRLHKTTPKPFGVASALVISGAFRVTRNPMYVGILLMLSGIACFFDTVSPWLVVPVLGILLDVIFVRREEEKMEMILMMPIDAIKLGCANGYRLRDNGKGCR